MNYVVEEIKDLFVSDELSHYGMPMRSGRYPYGSGKEPYQHSGDFLARVSDLRKTGMTEGQIAKYFDMRTSDLRYEISLAKKEHRAERVSIAVSYKNKGYTPTQIAKLMNIKNESSVRALLDEAVSERKKASANTAEFLKERIKETGGFIDISKGAEHSLGISQDMLNEAVYSLKMEGYEVYPRRFEQQTNPGKFTSMKVLCPPGTEHKEIYNNQKIKNVEDYVSQDGGETFKKKFVYPKSMDSKRMQVLYAEEGGLDRDGLVEIRPGVKDLSLGNSHYSQVRILVDDNYYIKGMAVYNNDLPDGVDIRVNSNKTKGTPIEKVLKPIDTKDPNNPFGSYIKEGGQSYYKDKDGNDQLSLINKRADEGDWDAWQKKLPSQFLAKQSQQLIDKQLGLSKAIKQEEFESIDALTNGTVKKRLLKGYADDCDSAAVKLKAAALPRQRYQVILPLSTLKDNEIYAPNFRDGEEVALVRFPHGGTFELPILKVSNKNVEGQKLIGKNPFDAVGVNKKTANQLSGADFDGDTVLVIPTKGVNGKIGIVGRKPFEKLRDFDPKMAYPERDGMKYMKDPKTGKNLTQNEMGSITNLIMDMTLKGATDDEVVRAVKHSMVVVDAGKHKLNYKQSEKDNGIAALKKKYQGHINEETGRYNEGASTLITSAKSTKYVNKRVGDPKINLPGKDWYDPSRPVGAKIYKEVVETYTDKHGKTKTRTTKSTKMMETDDAYKLSSGTPQENAYADYANYLKGLANKARMTMATTKDLAYNAASAKKYSKEVKSIDNKLKLAEMNKPKERQAQLIAETKVKNLMAQFPDMEKKEIKKARQVALTEARLKVGSKSQKIEFTDDEWEAVQAGAITSTKLNSIMNHADLDKLKERATPKNTKRVSDGMKNKIKMMYENGYTMADIADSVGLSISTIREYAKGKDE